MFIVTGGAGFIGSALIWKLNNEGTQDILVVDRMGTGPKWQNLAKRGFSTITHKDELFAWLETNGRRENVDAIFHLGASSATTEMDVDYLVRNNLNYSIRLWHYCVEYGIPMIYASSAATYGSGEAGFKDDHELVPQLRPLNPYGFSKQKFDHWVMQQHRTPPFWAGLKFFNVYGPQEYHKGSQASVIPQFLKQARTDGAIRLFKSYREGCADGDQRRDFVFVKDCIDVMWHLYKNRGHARSGLYNVGSGEARSFADVARATFAAAEVQGGRLEFIPMPEALRGQYQYFTQADLTNLREHAGYHEPMTGIEAGITDYVRNYLLKDDPFL